MLWLKKRLKVLWEICLGTPPIFNITREDGKFDFERSACARYRMSKRIRGGFRACLGREKIYKEF